MNDKLLSDFIDAWSRYLPINSEQTEHANVLGACAEFPSLEQHADVPTAQTRNTSMFTESVPTVPSAELALSPPVQSTQEDETDGLF